jgi:hypothetical protein
MTGCHDNVTATAGAFFGQSEHGKTFLVSDDNNRNPFHETLHIKIIILGLWFAKWHQLKL